MIRNDRGSGSGVDFAITCEHSVECSDGDPEIVEINDMIRREIECRRILNAGEHRPFSNAGLDELKNLQGRVRQSLTRVRDCRSAQGGWDSFKCICGSLH